MTASQFNVASPFGRFQAAAQPAASGRLSDDRRRRLESLIGQFFAETERRAEVLAEIRRDDAVPREDVACLGESILRKVQPSLSAMLESIEDKVDSRIWFWGRIDFLPQRKPASPLLTAVVPMVGSGCASTPMRMRAMDQDIPVALVAQNKSSNEAYVDEGKSICLPLPYTLHRVVCILLT